MTDLNELLERVKAATGPDKDIDVALLHLWEPTHEALRSYDERYQTELRDGVFSVWKTDGGYSASVPFPRFTSSIDAALALVERVLPGCEYEATNLYHVAMVSLPMNMSMVMDPQTARREDNNMPLTILSALLQALISQEQK